MAVTKGLNRIISIYCVVHIADVAAAATAAACDLVHYQDLFVFESHKFGSTDSVYVYNVGGTILLPAQFTRNKITLF